ncbi:MAG: hypothetical protein JWQ34_3621 [Mucilaginibacter sp.]|uniref:hypothetical protein n=1 Tax=Mucilaginibacter sp. TaxID=1882438 RepID=UPI00262E6BC4|nr:hypothetical protein [Mucilaginibacter sp.]MDB5005396.1 hypothetical protein [Mucilaginibacter sp.]
MKKLGLFIICFVLLGGKTKVHGQGISLNGIPQDEAKEMVDFYQQNRGQDTGPTRQSMWFDAATFKRIVDLLLKEKADPRHSADPTDGMRIYFASNLGVGPGRLRNTIIMMPTRKAGPNTAVISGSFHHDYFDHDPADVAILAASKEKLYTKRFYRRGEQLYNHNRRPEPPCTDPGPHYIDRNKAEQMVQKFGWDTMTTNSEWFDLDLLEDFVNDPHPHDGIRLYFAKHGPTDPDINKQEVKNKEAFIWVPTQSHGIPLFKTHKDYFDCGTARKALAKFRPLVIAGPGGQDNGELCPSNCDPNPPMGQ